MEVRDLDYKSQTQALQTSFDDKTSECRHCGYVASQRIQKRLAFRRINNLDILRKADDDQKVH